MLQTIQHLPEDRRPPMPIQHSRSSQDGDCYISHTSYIISALPTAPAGHHVTRLTSDPFVEAWGRYAPVKQEQRDENDATTLGSKELRDISTRLSSPSVKTQRRTSTAHLHVPGQGHLGLHVAGAWGLRHHPYGGRREVTHTHQEVTHLNPYSQQEIRRSPDCYPDITESPVQTLNVPQFSGQYDSGGQQHPSPPDRCPQSQSSPYLHRSMSDDDDSAQDDDYSDNASGAMHNSKISNDDGDDGPANLETRNGFRFSAPQSALSPVGAVSQPRAKREFVPDHKKDATYWNKRLKNNDSARRSRIKRKTMEKIMEHRMAELQKENLELRYELNALKRMLGEQLTSDLKPPKPSSSLISSSPSSSSSSSSLSSNSPFCLLTASSESGYEDHSNSSSTVEAADESGTKNSGYSSPAPVSTSSPTVTKGMSTSPSFPDEVEFSKKCIAADETMIYRPPLHIQGRGFGNQTGSGRNLEIVPNTSPFLPVESVHDVTTNARSSLSDSGTDSSPSCSPCSSEGSPDSSSSSNSNSNSSSSNSNSSSSGLFQTSQEKGSRGIVGNSRSWDKCVDIDLLQKIPLKFRIKRGLQPIATDRQLSRDDLK